MTIEQFKQSHNFSINETRWDGRKLVDTENIELIDPVMWATNDYFVSLCKWTFPQRKVYAKITHVTSGTHVPDSPHPKGVAIDEIIIGITLFEGVMLARGIRLNHGFSGVGFYPYGVLFMHVDFKDWNRDLKRTLLWYRDVDGQYIYDHREPEKVNEELMLCNDIRMGVA